MKGLKLGIFILIATLALVAVASAALPVTVTASLTHPNPSPTVPYWIVDITAGGNTDLPNGIYDGYCSDASATMVTTHSFDIFDSRVPASFPLSLPTADWNRINYVLNNKQGADKETLQAVFWHYGGTGAMQYGWDSKYNHAKYGAIVADADANGGSYFPNTVGQLYAVILWNPSQAQPAFIEATVITPIIPGPGPAVPEFPSIALPIAMMLGIAFIVYTLKGREK